MPSRAGTGRARSGYARLAQADEEEEQYLDDSDEDVSRKIHSPTSTIYAPLQPGARPSDMLASPTAKSSRKRPSHRSRRANSGVDIKAINQRLEKWAEEIAAKFKLRRVKGKSAEEEKMEIHHTVFQAPDWIRPASAELLAAQSKEGDGERMTKTQYDDIVESVKVAIELGQHPKMITQGSSGSYFCTNSEGKVVGVFKPKDEEPYASKNPKWTKWIHRNLFPFFFGRACLIPNLSYVSEAAAYILDTRLQTNIVPYTDIVHYSSISFNYDYWERRAYYRRKKALPPKVGSFQAFLRGYQDAVHFLKQHPWPDQTNADMSDPSGGRRSKGRWADECRPSRRRTVDKDGDDGDSSSPSGNEATMRRGFWTEALQNSFREELEKLVILDYIMRNTDRGLDNWMIKIDEATQKATLVADPQKKSNGAADPYQRGEEMTAEARAGLSPSDGPNVHLGAIDNSLSWPWKHPDAWRSFPFGWLFLPVSLIGQPFSERSRQHFLPLLTSKQWWSETQVALRECFSQDSDFKERMFARQMAVMKGQAWNVVETLKTPDHGPLELTRRGRVCVWDDLVEVPVVVPLRPTAASPAIDRRRQRPRDRLRKHETDYGDIGAARRSNAEARLRVESPPAEIPSPHRFELSRDDSLDETVLSSDASPVTTRPNDTLDSTLASTLSLPPASTNSTQDASTKRSRDLERSATRLSFDGLAGKRSSPPRHRKRNMSFTARRVSDAALDDDEGDLGYSAAQDMEGNRKRVIVERLEMIKSRGPFFTWC